MPKVLAAAPVVNRASSADLALVAEALRAAGRHVEGGPASEDLQTLVRRTLAPLSAQERARVLERLTHELDASRAPGEATALAEALARIAHVLRERLPYASLSGGRTLSVDALVGIDERTFYARGDARDTEAPAVSLVAVSPEGSRCELVDLLDDGTFAGCFELPVPSLLRDGWRFELRNGLGAGVEVEAPWMIRDLEEARDAVLADIGAADIQEVHPAVERLQERLRSSVKLEAVHAFGSCERIPEVSVIVPLGRRHHLLEQQLAQFAHDPDMRRVDLIYVLVEPEPGFLESARELERLYSIPFRVALLSLDPGEAVAADLGATLAESPMLGFLHPEALPAEPGWLRAIAEIHASEARDEAVVAAPLGHYGPLEASEGISVCLLVSADLYRSLEGIDAGYLTAAGALADLSFRLPGPVRYVVGPAPDRLDDSYWMDGLQAAESRYDAWRLAHRLSGGTG